MELETKMKGWIENVLEKHGYATKDVTFPNYDATGGAAADIIFVNVTATKNNEKEEFLELMLKKNKENIEEVDGTNMTKLYLNEVNVYSQIVPYFNQFAITRTKEKNSKIFFENIPFCYGTIVEGNNCVVVQENLKTQGYKLNEIKIPQDIHHVKLVVVAYAKWTALNMAIKDQEPEVFQRLSKLNHCIFGSKLFDMLVNSFRKEIDSVLKLYEGKNEALSEVIVEKLRKLQRECEKAHGDTFLNKDEKYSILRHADSWNNNFLFHYSENSNKPDRVKILDWQVSTLGSPMADLTQYLFYCSTIKELSHLDELLDLYYRVFCVEIQELGSDPAKCFPRECFLDSFKRYAPVAISGMFIVIRFACTTRTTRLDIRDTVGQEDFASLIDGKIEDPEGYFNRLNNIIKFSIERGFI